MGAHLGSVQIRSEYHVAVKSVAEHVANAMKIRMLIGPVIDGWIGLYPEGNGQDEKVGQPSRYLVFASVETDDGYFVARILACASMNGRMFLVPRGPTCHCPFGSSIILAIHQFVLRSPRPL
jgi:hypothetical protein